MKGRFVCNCDNNIKENVVICYMHLTILIGEVHGFGNQHAKLGSFWHLYVIQHYKIDLHAMMNQGFMATCVSEVGNLLVRCGGASSYP